jgi:PEP-CTERM motif-containing protein
MTNSRIICATAAAVIVGLTAESAWAFPPANPYKPTATEIQSMIFRTGDFSGGAQASTAVQFNIPEGIQLNVTWSTGAPFVNETFTRIVKSQRFVDDNGDGDGGDLDAFDGVAWNIMSDTAVAVRPYSQDWDNFNFQEGDQPSTGCGVGVICVPANTLTTVTIDWDDVGGTFAASARTNVFEIGFQIFGPSLAQDGSSSKSVITITSVPEPTSIGLACLGGFALLGLVRRMRTAGSTKCG